MTEFWKAIVLAIVEGVTEFLPVSSTGHLILVEEVLTLSHDDSFNNAFSIMIQLPAICAVVVYFWPDLWPWGTEGAKRQDLFRMWWKIAVAFIPAAILGPILSDTIDRHLLAPVPVSIALLLGGIVLIVIERRTHEERYASVDQFSYRTAFWIGCFQCLAMVPGTSRSAATIIGALLLGASRPAAAEFSFFLAIPTMLGATVFTMLKTGFAFTGTQWAVLATGGVVSFVVAYSVIAFLMRFVRNHSFAVFGYYRVVLGVVVLLVWWATRAQS